jgi:glycosyltransferase involved in cell wall biosynthesis
MDQFYRACDLVVIPSVAEPFGRVAIEAFFSSVPVVATAVGGLREIIRHNENGLLVPYGDVDAMVESISRIAVEPDLRGRLIASAQKDAQGQFTEKIYGRAVLDIMDRALKSSR